MFINTRIMISMRIRNVNSNISSSIYSTIKHRFILHTVTSYNEFILHYYSTTLNNAYFLFNYTLNF